MGTQCGHALVAGTDTAQLHVWEYALPEQTCHLASATFWTSEVFRTTRPSVWPCSAVRSRCCVISLAQSMTGLPSAAVWDRSTPLFVCQVRGQPSYRVARRLSKGHEPR